MTNEKFEFTISVHKYGILVKDSIPIPDGLEIIMVLAKANNYDIFDGEIARITESAFCITTKEKAALWKKDLASIKNFL